MGEDLETDDKKEPKAADFPKKQRRRKKLQYEQLKKQMEFYFSDANLSKDRFMNQLLQESQNVDLNQFLAFNRIKNITTNIKDIAKALQNSEFLKITECGTKVYRDKPIETKSNCDDCTIYVENLPGNADFDFLSNVFSTYGPIDYISIPRFSLSKKNKGFAFIEFKHPESVQKTVDAFKGFGCYLLDKIEEPAQLCSIKTYNEENELDKDKNNQVYKNEDDEFENDNSGGNNKQKFDNDHEKKLCEDPGGSSSNKDEQEKSFFEEEDGKTELQNENKSNKNYSLDKSHSNESRKKRKSVPVEDESGEEPETKKMKEEQFDEKPNSIAAADPSTTKRKTSRSSDQETSETDTKKKRKRLLSSGDCESTLGKSKIRKQSCEASSDDPSYRKDEDSGQECSSNKEKIQSSDRELSPQETSNNEDESEFPSEKKRKHRKRKKKSKREKECLDLQILTKKEWKFMRNKYLNEQRKRMSDLKKHLRQKRWEYYNSTEDTQIQETNQTEANEKETPTNNQKGFSDLRVSFLPGVIVKITMDEPIVKKEPFKNELKRNPEIKYIDIKDCSNIVHLRFSSADGAQKFIQNSPWTGVVVLEGTEEQEYWEKLKKDREQKISKNIRKPKNGRKKLLEKAEDMRSKHIWFE